MGRRNIQAPSTRLSVTTPYVDYDDAVVMIGSSVTIRAACLDASMELGARPVQTTRELAGNAVATVRPLVIVADEKDGLSSEELTDMAVSVGAQLVVAGRGDDVFAIASRVKLAIRASRSLREGRAG